VHEQQLLADVQRALQQLRLHALELGAAFEQRPQAHRVLDPQRLPQRDRLVGGLGLALVERLGFSRVATRELGVQMRDRLAGELGDRGAVARADLRMRERVQLTEQRFVRRADVRQRQRVHPARGARRVGECELRHRVLRWFVIGVRGPRILDDFRHRPLPAGRV